METALVSVIMPCYNVEKFIAQSIDSVQQQSYPHWELILVDDCSTDQTAAIIAAAAALDKRMRCITLPENSGTGVAREIGLRNAQGAFIAFLDADDLWKPQKLEKQLQFLAAHKLAFTFSFYDCIDEQGKELKLQVQAPAELSYRQLFFCNYVGNLTGIYQRAAFGELMISSSRKRQDWMLWLSIVKQIKKAKPLPESLAYYRLRQHSLSASKLTLLKHNFEVYRTFHAYNYVSCLFIMIGFLFTQLLIKPRYIKKLR